MKVRSDLTKLTPGHSARDVRQYVRSVEESARRISGVTSNDLLVLAVEAIRAVDQPRSSGAAIDELLERVGDGELVGVSGIPLSHVVAPELAAEVVMETLRRFRPSRLSTLLVDERERQQEQEADGQFRADMEAATGAARTSVLSAAKEPIVASFPCLIRRVDEEDAVPAFLVATERELLWAMSGVDGINVHMALRYQCEVVEDPQESDDEIDPWDLDDEEVAVHLRALGREQFWSDPVRLEIVRKRRDDWGNELVVQVEPHRVDELLDLVA